jgi:hypothetical protein
MIEFKEPGQSGDDIHQSSEKTAGQLLTDVTDIIKRYEAEWQKTGEKYNLFKAAGIAHKEVIIPCRRGF